MILLLSLILGHSTLQGEWSQEIPIYEGYTSYNTQHNISCDVNGGTHIIWFKWGHHGADYFIYYKYYINSQWINFTKLSGVGTKNLNYSPSITSWTDQYGNLQIYAFWETKYVSHSGEGIRRIVMRRFIEEWEDTIGFISSDTINSFTPCAVCDSKGVIHIVWEEGYEIHYKNFDGYKFSPDIVISNSGTYAAYPSIATSEDGKIFVVWEDLRDGNFEIYFREFNGIQWKNEVRVTSSVSASIFPTLCIDSNEKVHIVWQEAKPGGYKISYIAYDGTWETDTLLIDSPSEAITPSITSVGNELHLVWSDLRDGNYEIYYKNYTGETWGPGTRLTNAPRVSANPSIAADSSGNLYLLFWDRRGWPSTVYFKEKLADSLNETTQQQNGTTAEQLSISPNPFSQKTVISYSLIGNRTDYTITRLTIYDLTGRLIKTFNHLSASGGNQPFNQITWDGKNSSGRKMPSGIYFAKIHNFTKKIALIR
ncbi:T9SS type A sorting domain-containing protein [candidate division WOR-3 bacterium]|nr:T9SS type A sorting domain-containing protein [candidate division WOR-3 bacterium]